MIRFALVSVLLLGCDEWEPMQLQSRPDVYRGSPVFTDGRVMRPAVADTVEQGRYRRDVGLVPDFSPDAGWGNELPVELSRALVVEGRGHFEVFCAPCHGLLANGESVVARKMTLRPPPNLLVPREAGR